MTLPRFSRLLLLGAMSLSLLALPPAASGASPGVDGRIAYIGFAPIPGEDNGYYEAIFTANPDGSYPRIVPNTGTPSGENAPSDPVWSPDGTMLAFVSEVEGVGTINVIKSDGTGRLGLAEGFSPAWTPDGQWISYTVPDTSGEYPPADMTYRVPVGGGDPELVIDGASAIWSPDDTKIAFERGWPPDVIVRDLASGDEVAITPETPESWDFVQDWSPDSDTLVIASMGEWPDEGTTWLANVDGSFVDTIVATAQDPIAWSPSGTRLVHGYSSDRERLRIIASDGSLVANTNLWGTQPNWGTAPLVPDTTAPHTSSLSVVPRTTALSGTAIPLALTWSGGDDTGGSGIARYELSRSVNGGSWVTSSSMTTRAAFVTATSSGTVRYRVRAIDKQGNAGAWTYGLTLSPRLTQQTSSTVRFGGSWSTSSSTLYSGGSVRSASVAARSASYTFTGRSIALVTTKSRTRGKVKVYINGVYQGTVDLYRSTSLYRAVAWQKTWSSSSTRTIKLVVVGTSGRPRVDLDAFVVLK